MSEYAHDAIRFVISPPLTAELLPFQVPLRIVASAAVATVAATTCAASRRSIAAPPSTPLTVAAVRPAAAVLVAPLLRAAPSLVLAGETRSGPSQGRLADRDHALDRHPRALGDRRRAPGPRSSPSRRVSRSFGSVIIFM